MRALGKEVFRSREPARRAESRAPTLQAQDPRGQAAPREGPEAEAHVEPSLGRILAAADLSPAHSKATGAGSAKGSSPADVGGSHAQPHRGSEPSPLGLSPAVLSGSSLWLPFAEPRTWESLARMGSKLALVPPALSFLWAAA